MVKQAEELSKFYEIFVKRSFYATDKEAVFGGFTPTPFISSCFTSDAGKLFNNYWDQYCQEKFNIALIDNPRWYGQNFMENK